MELILCVLVYVVIFGMMSLVRSQLNRLERPPERVDSAEVCKTIGETVSIIEQFDNSSRVQFQEAKADVGISLVERIAAGSGIRCEYCHSIVPKDKINCPNCGAPR